MYSIAQTYRSGRKSGQAPIDEYQWKDGILGRVGIKRVETKRFIRFEHLRVNQKDDCYWYSRRSHWFIKFPYCKNDMQILIANIVFFDLPTNFRQGFYSLILYYPPRSIKKARHC